MGCSEDYIYGPTNTPIEQINLTTNTPTYLTYTPTNDTWLTTNNTGNQTGYWAYDAYGNLTTGTPTTPFGYSGQYTDASSGLVNDRARFYEPQTGVFTSRDPDFSSTDAAYTYTGGDPVNRLDATGLYFYDYYWDLGWIGQPEAVFRYFISHIKAVFPFSTGRCSGFYTGEHCNFSVYKTQDNLHVEYIYESPTLSEVSLVVDNWCQAGIPDLFCAAGDPPGSTVTFTLSSAPAWYFGQRSSSGQVDILEQVGYAPHAGWLTNRIAPKVAVLTWYKQAKNLAGLLGGSRGSVGLITGPGWSTSP